MYTHIMCIYIYMYTHVYTYYVYIYITEMRVIGTTWQIQGVPSGEKKQDLLELDGGDPCSEFTYGKSFL